MNRFLVIITFYGSDSYRVRNLQAVIKQLNKVWEGVDICLIEQNGVTNVSGVKYHYNIQIPGTLFHKTKLLNEAVRRHPDYTHYVMVDADSYIDSGVVDNIVNHCDDAPLIFPYETCVYLNEAQTRVRCNEGCSNELIKYNSDIPITRQAGLINCFSKIVYDKVKGFDEEFIGWGAEDDAFIFKVRRVCGKELRLKGGVVLHLWHKKANTDDYMASKGYHKNRCYCSLIRLMNNEEFNEYLSGNLTLREAYDTLSAKYRLGEYLNIKITDDYILKIDSSIYFFNTPNPTTYELLTEVAYEDGIDYTKDLIKKFFMDKDALPEVKRDVDLFIAENGIKYED